MRARSAVTVALVAAAAIVGACTPRLSRQLSPPAAAVNWPAALAAAQRAADEGRYGDAERELAVFAELHRGSREAVESAYWRALYQMDPRNAEGAPRDAVLLVDTLLLASGEQPRRDEALVLRRTALLVDSLRRVVATPKPPVVIRDTSREVALAREFEEQRKLLRDSLDLTLAELDRIRRALAERNPPRR